MGNVVWVLLVALIAGTGVLGLVAFALVVFATPNSRGPYEDFFANDMQLQHEAQKWLAENDLEFVLSHLRSDDPLVRSRVAHTLARFGYDHCNELELLASDKHPTTQYWAMVGLKNSECPRRVELARERADHPRPEIQRVANEILLEVRLEEERSVMKSPELAPLYPPGDPERNEEHR